MAWTQRSNHSLNNDSSTIETCCSDDQSQRNTFAIPDFPFSLSRSIMLSSFYVVTCSSLFMNTLLLWAIAPVSTAVLKAKRFIQNSSVANLLLAVTIACDPFFLSAVGGNVGIPPHICFFGIYATCINLCVYTQAICAIGLAADRVFATVRPLTYGTTGYGSTLGVALVFLPWVMAVALWSVFIFITWPQLPAEDIPDTPMFCFHLITSYVMAESVKMLDSFLAAVNLLSFLVYVSIFGVMALRDRAMQTLTTTTTKRTNLSLAKTYFLINVTTLCLYLPAPIYSFLTESALGEDATIESTNIASGLFLLYISNSCFDPFILISRIRSIRRNLPIVYKYQRHKRQGKQTLGSISGVVHTSQT